MKERSEQVAGAQRAFIGVCTERSLVRTSSHANHVHFRRQATDTRSALDDYGEETRWRGVRCSWPMSAVLLANR